MCGGGRSQRATIRKPDYKAMDRMAKRQFKEMRRAQDSRVTGQGNVLAGNLQQEELAYSKLRDLKVQEANNISVESARIAALLGTPPPDRGATAPSLGRDRMSVAGSGGSIRTGRRGSLRLGPLSPPQSKPSGGGS
jgi:hypothetical protein